MNASGSSSLRFLPAGWWEFRYWEFMAGGRYGLLLCRCMVFRESQQVVDNMNVCVGRVRSNVSFNVCLGNITLIRHGNQ